jgi:hypothetical protein
MILRLLLFANIFHRSQIPNKDITFLFRIIIDIEREHLFQRGVEYVSNTKG